METTLPSALALTPLRSRTPLSSASLVRALADDARVTVRVGQRTRLHAGDTIIELGDGVEGLEAVHGAAARDGLDRRQHNGRPAGSDLGEVRDLIVRHLAQAQRRRWQRRGTEVGGGSGKATASVCRNHNAVCVATTAPCDPATEAAVWQVAAAWEGSSSRLVAARTGRSSTFMPRSRATWSTTPLVHDGRIESCAEAWGSVRAWHVSIWRVAPLPIAAASAAKQACGKHGERYHPNAAQQPTYDTRHAVEPARGAHRGGSDDDA